MSITRAQTAKRLLNSIAPKGEKLAYINDKEAKLFKKMGGAGIDVNGTGIKSYVDFGSGKGSVSESLSEAAGVGSGYSGGGGDNDGPRGNFATINRGPKTVTTSPTDDYRYGPSRFQTNLARGANFLFNPNQLSKFAIDKQIKDQYEKDKQIASDITGLLTSGYGQGGIGSQYFGPVNNPMRDSYNKITGNVGPKGPPRDGGGDNNIPVLPILKKPINVPSDIEATKSDFDLYAALEGREAMKFGANPFNMTGAMQRFSEGGEVTVEDAEKMALPGESLAYINEDEAALLKALGGAGEPINQTGIPSYFFKKVFKKAGKAVKKVVKSPIGKAALLGAIGFGIPGTQFGGILGKGSLGSFFGKGSLNPFMAKGKFSGLGSILNKAKLVSGTGGLTKFGKLASIAGVSGLGGLLAAKEQDEDEIDISDIDRGEGMNIPDIVRRAKLNDPEFRFLPGSQFTSAYAEGGEVGGRKMMVDRLEVEVMPDESDYKFIFR